MNLTSTLRALRCAAAGMTVAIAGAASAQVCCKKPADAPAPSAATAPTPASTSASLPATASAAKKVTPPKSVAASVAGRPAPKPVSAAKPTRVASPASLEYIRAMTAVLEGTTQQ